ncbi:MAG: DUF1292 domain-containing protein [Clostridia bacterium]|nr:DUF1292 domain-containing protein [Clostridia bacterium]
MANKEKNERFVDKLFDDNNFESIFIKDNNGKEIEFDQVALVDYEGNYYAILMPLTKLEGVEEDEVLIFRIDEEKDCLVYLEDEKIANEVMDVLMTDDGEDEE